MKLKGTLFYSLLFCACMGTFFSLYKKNTIVLRKKIVVKFDALFSEKFKHEVLAFVKEQSRITTPAHVWGELFNNQFPFIKNVTLSFSDQKTTIQLTSHMLSSFINQQFVLLETGEIAPSDYYTKKVLSALQPVTIPQKTKDDLFLSSECKSFLLNRNNACDESYQISWKNPSCIEYYKNSIKIITTAQQPLNKKMEQQCCHIVQDIMQQPCKSKKKWSIDMRFKNQIIVAMM